MPQPPAPQLNDNLFLKIDEFESRIRVLERQGFDPVVGGPSGVAGGDLSGNYPNPKVVRAAGNFDAGDNIASNSGEAGQVRLGARASGGEIAVGAPTDSYVYRKAAGVIGIDNYLDANLGLRIGGNALASTHLSDSADILRGSGLAAQQYIFTGAGPTGPSVTVSPLGFNPGGSGQTALMLRSGGNASAFGNAQIAFTYDETNTYPHRINTRHEPTVQAGNAIDFYVWKRATDATTGLGSQHVLTLDATGSNITGGLKLNDGILDLSSASGITFPSSGLLDLSAVAATATSVGSGVGDKIALYTSGYGFGIQSNRLVAWLNGTSSVAFAVRAVAGAGQKSSGTDAISLFGDGSGVFTNFVQAAPAQASTFSGFRPGASGANAAHLQQLSGGSITSGLYAGFYVLSGGTYQASATQSTNLGIRGIEFLNGALTAGGGIRFYADTQNTTAGAAVTPGTPRMRITGTGNVLIGHETDQGGRLVLPAGSTPADGLWWGADTDLYRAAADTLKTDDNFIAAQSGAIGQPSITANQRFTVNNTLTDAATSQYGVRMLLSNAHAAAAAIGMYALSGEITITGTGNDTGIISALTGFTTYNATGVGSNINAIQGLVTHGALGGGIGTARGGYFRVDNSSTVNPITSALGLVVANNIGAGAITNTYGIDIQTLVAVSTAVGLQIAEPTGGTLRRSINLLGTSGLASSGIIFGNDVALYRSAADQLQVDDKFVVNHPAGYGVTIITPSGFTSLTARVAADTNDRVSIEPATSKINFGSGSATVDTAIYRSIQHTLPGLETDDPIRVIRVGVANQHIQLTPPDAGANYLDSWTSEANKKHLIFRTLHGSEGSPTGGQGFDWQVGPSSAPVTVASLSEAGNLNVAGASAGYSVAGVALKSTHLSDFALIAMLNENEIITGSWSYQASTTYRPAGTTFPYMAITMGTAANPAYLGWYNTAGARKGYIGWGTDTSIDMQVENGARFSFSSLALATSAVENTTASFQSGAHTFTGNVATQRMVYLSAPTYAGDALGRTITSAATIAITGAPVAGTNMAISNSYALWAQAGMTRLDGGVNINAGATISGGTVINQTAQAVVGLDVNGFANSTVPALRISAGSSPNYPLFEIRNSTPSTIFSVDAGGKLTWLADATTNLYRNATGQLKTDSNLWINNATGIGVNIAPDPAAMIALPSGTTMATTGIKWGSGAQFYSDTTNRLRFDSILYVPANVVSIGTAVSGNVGLRVGGTKLDDPAASTARYALLIDQDWKPTNDIAKAYYGLNASYAVDTSLAAGALTSSQYAVYGNVAYSTGTQSLAALYGGRVGVSTAAGVGLVGVGYNLRVTPSYLTPVTTHYGIYIDAPQANSATTSYGLYVESVLGTGTTTSRSIYVSGGNVRFGANLTTGRTRVGLGLDATVGQLQLTSSTVADDGIYFGTDTVLYRGAADQVTTDDAYASIRVNATDAAFFSRLSTDTTAPFLIQAGGQIGWGAGGSSARDTFVSRTASGQFGVGPSTLLDLGGSSGTAISTGSSVGDKIALYSNTYGLGIQSSRMVAWLASTSGAFAVRVDNAAGQHSAGTDVWAAFGSGAVVQTQNSAGIAWTLNQPGGGVIVNANRTDVTDAVRWNMIAGAPYASWFQVSDDNAVFTNVLGFDKSNRVGVGNWTSGAFPATLSFPAATNAVGGIDFGGDVSLYRSAANILRTDDLIQSTQTVAINTTDFNTYGWVQWQNAQGAVSVGSDATSAYIQSWNSRPLRLNSQGQLVYVGSGLSIAGGLTVTSGTITFPTSSLNGNAIMDGTLPIGAFGFIFGGNNLLYNSGFEASATADADPQATYQPWDGWFITNGTLSLVTKPTTELRASTTLPQATILIKSAGNWTAPGTARIAATTFTYTGIATDLDGLVTLTGCSGGTGTFPSGTPITQDPQGVDANRIWGIGNNAVKATATASASDVYLGTLPTRYVPVTPLKTYTGSIYMGANLAGRQGYARIMWLDSTRAFISNSPSTTQTLSTTGMTRAYVTAPAPANAAYARVDGVATAATVTAGDIYYFDSFMLSDGDMLFAYEPRADEILPGSINATMIQAGAITGDAIVANFSITGKRIQTAPSGQRVVLEGDSASTLGEAGLGVYNSAGALRVRLGEVTGMTLFSTAGISDPVLKLASTGGLMVGSPTGARTIFDNAGVSIYDSVPTLRVQMSAAVGLELRDTSSNVQVKLSGTGGLQTIGSGGAVFFDSTGLTAYNSITTFTAAQQVIQIDRNTGKLTMGVPTLQRVEVDRTSMRFYDSAGVLGLYTDFGGLRTSSTTTYTELDSAGLRSFITGVERVHIGATGIELNDTGGVTRVLLSTDGGLKTTGATGTVILNDSGLTGYNSPTTLDATTQTTRIDRVTGSLIIGPPSAAARIEADRTSMRFFQSDGVTVGLYARAGMVSTAASSAGARIDIDGATDTIGIYSATQPRVTLDPTNGLRLHNTSGTPLVFLSATGGLTTQASETSSRVTLNSTGLISWDASNNQTVLIDSATGKAILGNPTGRKLEADRTSLRFFDDALVQQFSIINGVLTTGTVDTGARVRMDSAGIKAYNAGGVNTVAINSDGSATFTGTINLVGSTLTGTIGGDNLAYNSGFEILTGTGYDGWQILGGGTGSIVTNLSAGVDAGRTVGPGTKALKITIAGTAQYGYVEATSTRRQPVVGGESYALTAYVGASTTGRTAYMSVIWWNSAGTQIGATATVAAAVSISSTGMTRIGGVAIAPGAGLPVGDVGRAVAATIRPVGSNNTVAGDAYYFDNLMMQQGNVPTEYAPRSDELLAGTTWESNLNTNVSKVMMDLNGIRGYDASAQTFNLATTGLLTLGNASPGARMEADRTSFRYFNSSNLQTFSIINGVLTTGTADSGARVRMDNLGIKAYNAAGVNTVQINSDGTAYFSGAGGGNLLPNSGAEVYPGQWLAYQGTLAQELTEVKYGTSALKLTVTTAPAQFYQTLTTPTKNGARIEPGKTYTFSGWVKAATAGRNAYMMSRFCDAAGVILPGPTPNVWNYVTGTNTALSTTGWTRLVATGVAPPNARFSGVTIMLTDSIVGDVFYADGFQIEEGEWATAYSPVLAQTLSEVSIDAGVITAGTFRGTTFETSANVNVSKVMFDSAGIRGYDAAAQSFNLATTGLLTLGNVSPGARMEADRTSFRYYNSSNLLQFSVINGVLTTAAATGARVELSSAGLKAYNSSAVNTVAINTDGSAYFRGNIDLSNSTYAGTASGATLITPGSITFAQLGTTIGGGNLLPNSSFEHPVLFSTGWTPSTATLTAETTTVHQGGTACRVTGTGTTGYIYRIDTPVTEAKQYMASAWVWVPTARSMRIIIYGYDVAKASSLGNLTKDTPVPATTWTRIFSGPFTMPAAAVWARITVQDFTLATGDYFITDDIQIEEGDVATSWQPPSAEILPGTKIESNANNNVSKVMMDLNGFRAYDASGPTVNISNTGVIDLGPPTIGHVSIDRTSMRFYQSDGTTVGLTARAGIISTAATASGARVEMDGTGTTDKFAVYSSTQERVTLEGVQGLTLRDSSGVAKLYLSALGGLTTVAADTAQRVTLNGLGLLAYDTGGLQTVQIDSATGKIVVGNPTGQRMEATRTTLGFYSSTNTLGLSLGASGGLTTQAAETSQRVTLSSAGLVSYNTSNQQTILIDAATGKIIIGPPTGAARVEADRTSMTFYNSDGITAGLVATAGKVVSNTSVAVARIELDGVLNQFSAYDTVRQRLGIDGTNGMRLWDAAGVLGLQSSAGGLVTGAGDTRVELLGDGLTLYSAGQRSIKLDAVTGELVAGADPNSQRIELDLYGFRMYDSNNTLGVHSTGSGWSTGIDPNGRVEMDALGLRTIAPGGITIMEVFTDGVTPSYFRGALNADGGIIQPVTADGTVLDGNKYSWRDTSGYEVAYIGTAVGAGSDQYSTSVKSTSVLRNYWRLGEVGGLILTDTVGLSPFGGLTGAYTLGVPSLVINESSNTAIQFTGAGGRASTTNTYGYDALGTPAAALNARVATYGGSWATSGSAGADWATTTSDALFARAGAVRSAVSDTAGNGKVALLGTTSYSDIKLTMQMGFEWLNTTGTLEMGFVARYVNATNYLKAVYRKTSTETTDKFRLDIVKVVGGVPTTLVTRLSSTGWPIKTYNSSPPTLTVDTKGKATFTTNANAEVAITATDSDLATGGVLATGRVGMWDMLTGTGSGTSKRIYYDFKALSPAQDFQQATFTWEGWVKPTTVDATDRIIFEVAPTALTAASGWRITHSTAGVKLWYVSAGTIWTAVTGVIGTALTANQTTHLAVQWGANSGGIQYQRYTILENGVVSATGIDTAAKNPNGYTHPLGIATIGASGTGTQPFLGVIDEVAFYSNTVVNTKIKEHNDIGVSTGIADVELRAKVQGVGGDLHEIVILDQDGNSSLYPKPVMAKATCITDFLVTCTIPAPTIMPFDTVEYESTPGTINTAAFGQPGAGEITFPEDGTYVCTAQWNVGTAVIAAPATYVDCFFEYAGVRRGEVRTTSNVTGMMVNVSAQFQALAGGKLTFKVGSNKGGTGANGAGSAGLPQYVSIAKVGGPKGDAGKDGAKGDPGYFENIYINGAVGPVQSFATGSSWQILPLPTAAASYATPVGAFTRNADGTLTVRDAGYYLIEADVGATAAWTTASIRCATGIQLDTPGDDVARADSSSGPGGANALPFTKLSGHTYIAAGQKVVVSYSAATSAGSAQIVNFSISRVGAGPQGIKGDTGTPGATGAKGDPGYYEYALESYTAQTFVSMTSVTWVRLALPVVNTQSTNATDSLRWNADGSVTMLQAGWYTLDCQIQLPAGTAGAGWQFGWWATTDDTTPVGGAAGALYKQEIPAPIASATAVVSMPYTGYFAANSRVGVSIYNRGATASGGLTRWSIARIGAGPAGAKGDAGPVGPASNTNVPVATILQTAVPNTGGATTAPGGFLFCDGSPQARVGTYAALFAAIGTTYGAGDGSTTFNLPDLVGRFALGAGTPATPAVQGGVAHALGSKGGEEQHILTGPESGIAAHKHTISGSTAAGGAHAHNIQTQGELVAYGSNTYSGKMQANSGTGVGGTQSAADHAHGVGSLVNANAGPTNAVEDHNTMPPFTAINYMIKY